jgi:hypothetical protein
VEAGPVPQDHGPDVVLFEVQRQGGHRVTPPGGGDLQHLGGHGVGEAVDAGNPVLHLQDLSHLLGVERLLVVVDGAEKDALDLARAELCIGVGH